MQSDFRTITGADLIDDNRVFPRAVLRATRRFARSKPWCGTIDERKEKFQQFSGELASALGIPEPSVLFGDVATGSPSDASSYRRRCHTINLRGRLSVVTLLNLFAAAAKLDQAERYAWSLSLFKRCFPISFSRCRFDGLLLRRN